MTCSWWCICCSSAQLTSRWNLFVFRASFLPLSSLRCLSSSQPFSMHYPRTDNHAVKFLYRNENQLFTAVRIYLYRFLASVDRVHTRLRALHLWPSPANNHRRPDHVMPLFLHTYFLCLLSQLFNSSLIAIRIRLPKMTIFHLVNECQIYGHV